MGGRALFVAALVATLLPLNASAQAVRGGDLPGRERERFVEPPPPLAQPRGPTIALPSTAPPSGADKLTVNIRDICIKGATVYTKEELAPLYADMIGHDVPVLALYDLAKRITAKYGDDGYVLSRAIVPPQTLSPRSARPCLKIIEGYVDNVEWPAAVGPYRDFFTEYTAKITAQRPANIHTIERYLLLAGDLPGLHFNASLKPSKTHEGASTLVVEVVVKPLDLYGRLDNRGTPSRGPTEYLAAASFNNLLHQHESLTLNWADTIPHTGELKYAAVNYRQVLTAEGLFGFVNASYGFGHPGTEILQSLDFKTASTLVEAGLAYPVIRSREKNLTLSGLAFMSDNVSDTNVVSPFQEDRLRGIRFKADGDWADRFLGINQVNFTYSQGFHGLGSTDNADLSNPNDTAVPSRAAGRVDFEKIEATLSRTQPLYGPFSAFGSIYGQYAFTPLLVSEQCGYGGRFFGRAYDPSELLGDHCLEGVVELRYDVPKFAPTVDQVQLYAFSDYGRLWLLAPASNDPSFGTQGNFIAASAGIGARLGVLGHYTADLSVAKAIEGTRDDTRVFFILAAKY